MSTVTIKIEGTDEEIKEAVTVILSSARTLINRGFMVGEYEIGPEDSTMTLGGRSMQK